MIPEPISLSSLVATRPSLPGCHREARRDHNILWGRILPVSAGSGASGPVRGSYLQTNRCWKTRPVVWAKPTAASMLT
jgi:hypothetical protein